MPSCGGLRWAVFLAFSLVLVASAQVRLPPSPAECGFRCGLVLVAPGTYMDCGPCPGVCGDTICQHGIGETHANCPADCVPGPCASEGCLGRCGIVRDQCHRLINCGPCPSSCGDDICDPGEWITCQADCGASCTPEPACGLRCGIVDDGCGFYLDCGPCDSQCGNGLCQNGETNALCPEDCVLPGCVSSGCGGACGAYVDNCGRLLACPTCGSHTQCPHPNGVCEPELGEDNRNCRFECPYGCGDGVCAPNEPLRCPVDCDSTLPDGITAGGPYTGVVGEGVRFFGLLAPSVAAQALRWTFGDGATATGRTAEHVYTLPGPYEVVFEVTLADGSVLRSFTSASITPAANTNGYEVAFTMHYDAAGDGIVATASIHETPGPPGAPRTPATALAIFNPSAQLVHQTGWMPLRADADPIVVPALAHPTPGVWRGQALFAYVDLLTQQLHPLGTRYATTVVLSSQCTGCLTLSPEGATMRDGQSQELTATLNASPQPDSFAWAFAKPPGSSSVGSVEFSGSAASVSAQATWFALPDQECVSSVVLRAQAFENAKYAVKAAAQAGTQLATGQAELTVQMPWGIGTEHGGTNLASLTLSPRLVGQVRVACPALPSSSDPCRVTGHTFVRTAPLVCWPETADAACGPWRAQFLPLTSSFRQKVTIHEDVHVQQFNPGRYYGDLWTIDGPHGIMSFTVPGKGIALRNLTASSSAAIRELITATIAAWDEWSTSETFSRRAGAEPEAYATSDSIAPRYLLQGCNLAP